MASVITPAGSALIERASPIQRAVAVVIGALLLTAALSLSPLFRRVELWLGDLQQGWVSREMSFAQTLIVDIDEESLRRLEPYLGVWPYKRDVYALVLDYLHELGARAVCFDILMSERRQGDSQLSLALKRHPNTVIAAVAAGAPLPIDTARRERLDHLSWALPESLQVEPWADFSLPLVFESSSRHGGVGVVSLWSDDDGSVRRIPLFHHARGATLPTLALAAMFSGSGPPRVDYDADRREISLAGHVWPVDDKGRVLLSFPPHLNALKTVPFHVLALAAMGAAGAPGLRELVKEKMVIVGSTALQTDAVHTPRGLMPGAHLLAVVHENLVNDQLLKQSTPFAATVLLVAALTVPVGCCIRRRIHPLNIGISFLAAGILAWATHFFLMYLGHQYSPLLFALTAALLVCCGLLADFAVTERRRRGHAEAQMRIASAVFNASKEGIFVTDADDRIVSINPAFTEITGFSEQEAVGRSFGEFYLDQHDAAILQSMLQSLRKQGYWQGEIWSRRKDGEIFPEWLSVNALYGNDGALDKRIAVFSDLSRDRAAEEKITFLSYYDPLTALPNRALLRDRAYNALASAARVRTKVVLMLIDLDRFNNIVDSLGYALGDQVLLQVAERLRSLLVEGDTASRHGGDEFMLLLPGDDSESAAHLAERIIEAISLPFLIDGHELALTVSIGIAEYPENGVDYDTLSRSADSALHRAKQAGGRNFHFFTASMHQHAQELMFLENSLRHAVERDELILHYQPKVEASSGRLVGLEALVRWMHPVRGLIPPGQFIPVAEESGIIREVGDWVLQAALKQTREWIDHGLTPVPVAVNLSLAQFKQSNLDERLAEVLQIHKVRPELLELELTESVAMESIAFTLSSIEKIKHLGVGLSIDDFGTGYSSLSYLKRFAIDKIKIDRSFVCNLSDDNGDASIVRAIIGLAHNLGFRVVAEGVETAEQLAFMRRYGCDEVQGFYFCRPLPAEDIAYILRQGRLGAVDECLAT